MSDNGNGKRKPDHNVKPKDAKEAFQRTLDALHAVMECAQKMSQIALEAANSTAALTTYLLTHTQNCANCLWRGPKVCQRYGSEGYHKHTDLSSICGLYTPTHHPVAMEPSAPGPKQTGRRRPGQREKRYCTACGGHFAVSKSGRLFPHDIHGTAYAAGNGDRAVPCAGIPQE